VASSALCSCLYYLILDTGYLILMLNPVSSIQYPVFFLGDNSGGVTPVPIPNTAVKTSCADGTSRATSWESRTLPRIFLRLLKSRLFYCPGDRNLLKNSPGSAGIPACNPLIVCGLLRPSALHSELQTGLPHTKRIVATVKT
jgi:hypothetical protein